MNEKYKLYHGDCLEVMDKLIEAGVKVDAIITDTQYGTTGCKWDSVIQFNRYIVIKEGKSDKILYEHEFILRRLKEGINMKEVEKEWKENSKEGMWEKINKLIKPNGAICLFSIEPFGSLLRASNIKNYRYDWQWFKSKSGNFMMANKQPHKRVEYINVFYSKQPTYNPLKIKNPNGEEMRSKYKPSKQKDKYIGQVSVNDEYTKYSENYEGDKLLPISLLKFKNVNKPLHPTQKPVDLLEYLIKNYTNEGELVLDFTMGSGSTGVACLNTNRRFIGIELDEKYFNIAKERIEEAKNNQISFKLGETYE